MPNNDCRVDVDGVHLEYLQNQVTELAKHSIDWRFMVMAIVPISITIGGSLISIAIQVNTTGERINNLNSNLVQTNTNNRRELDLIYQRLDYLERKGVNVKE